MVPRRTITGQFTTGTAGEMFGPFEDKEIAPHPMKDVARHQPKYNDYIKDSRLCGNCHTINLPVMDQKPFGHSLEQVTYLEWLNSEFQTDFNPGPNARSCQACHMSNSYANAERQRRDVEQIQTAFADVQDDTYPAAEHTAPMDQVRARFREKGFARHQLQGLNVFLLEMFNQFMTADTSPPPNFSNDILGVRKSDYMSTLSNDLQNAIVELRAGGATGDGDDRSLAAGDRCVSSSRPSDASPTRWGIVFPAGSASGERSFEFDVMDTGSIDPTTRQPKIVWSSARPTRPGSSSTARARFWTASTSARTANRKGPGQPHFWGRDHPITSSGQVQIYEELVKDADGNYTTSFLRRTEIPKDNRLLPRGWTKDGPAPQSFKGEFLHSTFAEGDAANDPAYRNGSGTSVVRYEIPLSRLSKADTSKLTVKATLYYQSIPPYYLTQRFEQAPHAPGTQRLFYLTSRLNTKGTPIESWKLLVATSPAKVPRRVSR